MAGPLRRRNPQVPPVPRPANAPRQRTQLDRIEETLGAAIHAINVTIEQQADLHQRQHMLMASVAQIQRSQIDLSHTVITRCDDLVRHIASQRRLIARTLNPTESHADSPRDPPGAARTRPRASTNPGFKPRIRAFSLIPPLPDDVPAEELQDLVDFYELRLNP
ncbi:MAG TPA: hypothetical protein VLS45_08060 [Methylomicrobium sp.]|nr:hypothetical protein [Methylomicrobium sp.]